jgi:predicted ArsR family transcriptional regulator
MIDEFVSSDVALLERLQHGDGMTISDLATAMEVTPTAVRQRLNRLLAQGYVARSTVRHGRGRPNHRYHLTREGQRKVGSNYPDLALALWQEVCQFEDQEIRRNMMHRLVSRLAVMYAGEVRGRTLEEKMKSLSGLFAQRRIPLDVDRSGSLPVLHATTCPYPDLVDQDRSICSLERMLFSELLGAEVQLAKCRLDGADCCTFQSN